MNEDTKNKQLLASLSARLSILELAIEVEIANNLASRPKAETKEFAQSFIMRAGQADLGPPPITTSDEQFEAMVAEKIVKEAERLAARISVRTETIRTLRPILGKQYSAPSPSAEGEHQEG